MNKIYLLLTGDCRSLIPLEPPDSLDALITDPPFELGLHGLAWDSTGVAFDPQTWRGFLRVLKPGAHALVFGGTRTYHRLAVAIEDAGFEIRDMLLWVHNHGFPKSKDLGGGVGTALKPTIEALVLARKPCEGTISENFAKWGVGGLNIDECRYGDDSYTINSWREGAKPFGGGAGTAYQSRQHRGRHPTNLVLCDDAAPIFGAAAKAYPVFRSRKVSPQERKQGGAENTHPTAKPVELLDWLVRLVTPVDGWVLDPFMGSGSVGVAALRAGRRYLGAELQPEYFKIAAVRIAALMDEQQEVRHGLRLCRGGLGAELAGTR